METFRKYVYASQEAWETQKALIVQTDEEGNESYNESVVMVVELGHLVETPAVLDEDGEVVSEAVLSTDYCVDILWRNEPHADFVPTWITPIGIHTFGSKHAAEYAKAYCEANPEAEYCNPPAPEEL
jgi:hypothetical protein